MDVAVCYKSNAEMADAVCAAAEGAGVRAKAFQADVSSPESVDALFKEVKESMGPVSVLVNNAGIARDNLLIRMKTREWDEVLASDLSSAFYCARAALRDMVKARYGRVVCVASVVGLVGNAGQCNYGAAKAGLIGFAKSAAREYAGKGVTVNVVAPGFIDTDMTGVISEDSRTALLAQIPVGRLGRPEDVAEVVAFLASDASAYVTGQVLAVDGGMTMC
jgi:3-oxoacyl-[acyl-carrier protein] reductase